MTDYNLISNDTKIKKPNEAAFSQSFIKRFVKHRAALIGFCFLAFLSILCFLLPVFELLTGHNSIQVDMGNRFAPPSFNHFLGTDELGRDIVLRLLQGGQVSLIIGLMATILAAIIGTLIGVIAGYAGGRIDDLLMRFTDIVIALPLLPVLIVLGALDWHFSFLPLLRADLAQIIIIIGLFGWPLIARLVRAGTLQVRKSQYVLAAHAMGAGHGHIILRHILPNVLSPVIVAASLSIGNIILLESVLSFLGLGIQPPLASWGNMLTHAQDMIWHNVWLTIYPGLMIFLTVIAFNFIGDGMQDALNTRRLLK